jgi:hypothetical protein
MRTIAKKAWCAGWVLCAALPALAQTLTLTPSGNLTGASGSTVGWGFTIVNPTLKWIEITSANFCEGSSGETSSCTGPSIGTFTDFISGFNDIVVGPNPNSTTVSQAFKLTSDMGIGGFLITASSGTTGTAQIVLTYNVFSVSPDDPSFDPDSDTVSTDNFLTAPASVAIQASTPPSPPSETPAPPSWLLTVLGVLSTALVLRRRQMHAARIQ